MSISAIRRELTESSRFSATEIDTICASVSSRELESLGEKKNFSPTFLSSIYFSFFMILATIGIFIYSFFRFRELRTLAERGQEVADVDFFLPAAFMLTSIIYLVRHIFTVIKKLKSKNQR